MAEDNNNLKSPLDYAYGQLNPLFKRIVQNQYDSDRDPATHLRNVVSEYYTPKALDNVGPYKAIVLRVEARVAAESPSPHSINSPQNGKEPDLVRITCRIPELHAHLPIPELYGDVEGPHHAKIDLHHTFVAQSDAVPEPATGELVWVNFIDQKSMLGAMYIRPVVERESLINTIAQRISPAGTFAGAPCTNINTFPSSGDGQPGQVSNTVLTGLPQTPRVVEPTGENKIQKGEGNPSENVIGKWIAGVSKAGIKGSRNYFYRPLENRGHHVIIHIPGTTALSSPVELAYFFHGAGSWEKQTLFNALPAQAKQMGSEQRRNIVTVFVENRPASGSPRYFTEGGGSFSGLDQSIEALLQEFSDGPVTVAYRSITFHSMAGRVLGRILDAGDLNLVDKITAADIIAAKEQGRFNWEKLAAHIVEQRVKPLEVNIFSINTNKPISEASHRAVLKRAWDTMRAGPNQDSDRVFLPSDYNGEYNPTKGERALRLKIGDHTHLITLINKFDGAKGGHTKYGLISYPYINPFSSEQTPSAPNTGTSAEPEPIGQQPNTATKNSTTEKCADAPTLEPRINTLQQQYAAALEAGLEAEQAQLEEQIDVLQERLEGCADTIGPRCTLAKDKYCDLVEEPIRNKESRVRIAPKGALKSITPRTLGSDGQPLLVEITNKTKQRKEYLHRLAKVRLDALNAAWQAETGREQILVSSAWRKKKTESYEQWKNSLVPSEYANERELRRYRAYNSPHETGLAIDFGNFGLTPSRSKIPIKTQQESPLWLWLNDNAHKFGLTPYLAEPWHWEVNVPVEAHSSGEEFVSGESFAVRVKGQGRVGSGRGYDGLATTSTGVGNCGLGTMSNYGSQSSTGTGEEGGGKIVLQPRNDSKFATGPAPCAVENSQVRQIVGSNSPINFNDPVFGIDVHPVNQPPSLLDYGRVREAGASFVIINTTQGDSDMGRKELYRLHYRKAKDAGLLVGTYHFAYPGPNDVESEAQAHLRTIQSLGGPIDICPFLDLESSGFREGCPTDQAAADWIDKWLEIVKQEIGKVGGYIGRNTLRKMGIICYVPSLPDIPHWHANYPKSGPNTLSLNSSAIQYGRTNPSTFNKTPQWPTTMWQFAGGRSSGYGQIPGQLNSHGETMAIDLNVTDQAGLNKIKL